MTNKNVCKLGTGAEGKLKHYTNPTSVRRSTQNMTNKNVFKLGKGAEGKLKHYTNLASARRSTQNMTNKRCANWVWEPKGNEALHKPGVCEAKHTKDDK